MGQHGGDIYSEEIQKQIAKEDRKFLDFSANINPLGMPAGVRLAERISSTALPMGRSLPMPF